MPLETQLAPDHDTFLLACEAPRDMNLSSSEDCVAADDHSASYNVKKPTRKWAAWTRLEEANFFNALRLVGKNFDKITSQVQTKNKEQVRHYYYRLIKRMNKLLPGFSLDAKNSRDTIAAMLRWWSLLEKYSCTASKLHLKPRRFKIFVDALEHHLQRDRKRRKRPSHGSSRSKKSKASIPTLGKLPGEGGSVMKVVIVTGNKVRNAGSGRNSSSRHNANASTGCINDQSAAGIARQQQRTGTAAFLTDHTEVMDGLCLVANAAEQLKEADKSDNHGSCISNLTLDRARLSQRMAEHSRDHPSQTANLRGELPPKLKLQLFPADETTRIALVKDQHNPHLELTLSARKKISSVMEHLIRKWKSSDILLSGRMEIFPYVWQDDVVESPRWTMDDTNATAGEVYAAVGVPSVFRLRYGWFPKQIVESTLVPRVSLQSADAYNGLKEAFDDCTAQTAGKLVEGCNRSNYTPDCFRHMAAARESTEEIIANYSKESTNEQKTDLGTEEKGNGIFSPGNHDGFSDIDLDELMLEDANIPSSAHQQPSQCSNPLPFSCDSFDAAIAAHLASFSDTSFYPTIWDGEDTHDTFQMPTDPLTQDSPTSLASGTEDRLVACSSGMNIHALLKVSNDADVSLATDPISGFKPCDVNDIEKLSDIYWPDSLDSLDLDVPAARCASRDQFLGDYLPNLCQSLTNNIDACQDYLFGVRRGGGIHG